MGASAPTIQSKYRWPSSVRCICMLTVDFDGPSHEIGRKLRPLGINSWGRYSGRRGIPRYLDLFEEMIRYIKQHEGVRFVNLRQLAGWCLSNRGDFE